MASSLWIVSGIFGVVAAVAAFMWLYGVEFHPMQITIVAAIIVIGLVGTVVYKVLKLGDSQGRRPLSSKAGEEMNKASEFARRYWKETYGEDLSDKEFKRYRRAYKDGSKAWGIVANRAMNSKKPGAPVVVVVGRGAKEAGMEIIGENDHPGPDEIEDPFFVASAGFTGAPFPGMSPQDDASFQRFRHGPDKGPMVSIGMGNERWENFVSGKKREER
jgi:hypothetical protein